MWLGLPLSFWQTVFFWATVAAAIAGAISISAAFVSAIVGYKVSDWVQADADARIAEAGAAAAEANKRVAELNNETERLKAENLKMQTAMLPRRIVMADRNGDKDLRQARFKEVAKYAGTVALIQSVPDFEAQTLASDIRVALSNSGWSVVPTDEMHSRIPNAMIMAGVRLVTLEGTIDFSPGKVPVMPGFSQAAKAAIAVQNLLQLDLGPPFGPALFGASWSPEYSNPDMGLLTRAGFKFPPGAVVILVGPRPIEYSLTPAPAKAAQQQ